MKRKVGILYDNISGNIGDLAVGISVRKILGDFKVPFEELVPGRFNPQDYQTIIVGGGYLLRLSPDFFYDKFKIPGPYILNACGIVGKPDDLDYLNDYSYVSVRSNGDKQKLFYLTKEVKTVPCTAMLLNDLADIGIKICQPSIGVNLGPGLLDDIQALIRYLSKLPFHIYLLPITHYNHDFKYLVRLRQQVKNCTLLPVLKPEEIFTIIGKFDYFISASLHGAIFSYVHNTPFILSELDEKMTFFMKERGLDKYLFKGFKGLKTAFEKLLNNKPDYSVSLTKDMQILKEHKSRIKDILCVKQYAAVNNKLIEPQVDLESLKADLQERDTQIQYLRRQVEDLECRIFCPEKQSSPGQSQLAELEAIYNSNGWKFLNCYYRLRDKVFSANTKFKAYILTFARALRWLFFGLQKRKYKKVWEIYKSGGISLCWHYTVKKFDVKTLPYEPYRNQLSISQSEYLFSKFSNKPLFSIIVPVYKVKPKWLEKCISSVVNQHYQNWELILVDDASQKDDLRRLIDVWVSRDDRIRAYFLQENAGIAGAANFGIEQANGELVGFLDHDDELTLDALTWVSCAINKHPKAQWFYSDEDMISAKGKCHSPHFKPDFSPEFLLANMFTCHFSVYSKHILNEVGGLRKGFDGSQDHDLALRLCEIVPREKIIHIPRVLYHWREISGSAAMGIEAKPQAPIAGRKAVADALKRRNLKGKVSSYEICPTIYQIEFEPSEFPKVSIIIPTRNALSLTKACIDSLWKYTNYPNFEIIVIDNQSDDKSFLEYIQHKQSQGLVSVIRYDKPFNHSDMNNMAVKATDSEFILFMNNDIEITSEQWLEQLVASAQMDKSIAVVGGLLLYPNQKVQHGGIILGIGKCAGHAHKYIHSRLPGYFGRLHALQEVSGITAALALVRRRSFEDVGGFDSNRYPTSFNDVDLCIRLRTKGYRCIYNPMVQAIHYETKTRPVTSEELIYRQNLASDYAEILNNDPFYNPNLSLNNEQFHGCRYFPPEEQIPEWSFMTK